MLLESVQVYEGDGVRYLKPRPQKIITKLKGRVSFHYDGIPIHFDYEIEPMEQGGRVTNQNIRFWCPGVGMHMTSSYIFKGEPRPKVEGFKGNDNSNYMAITWEITKQTLIDVFLSERSAQVRRVIAHGRQFGKKRIFR